MKQDLKRRTFLHGTAGGAAAMVAGGPMTAGAKGPDVESSIIRVAQQQVTAGYRQLFLDDVMVERANGLKRVLHPPQKYQGNPIIQQGQTAWNEYRTQLYGTVLYFPEEKKFKMWYLSGARLPYRQPILLDGRARIPNYQLVGYAESHDGFHWKLPHLGLVEYNGSRKNNICRIARTNVEGIAVLYDPRDSDSTRRYKALYWEHSASNPEPEPGINGISVSYSADGKDWTDDRRNPVIPYGSDTGQQVVWDERIEKYVAFGRFNAGGRKVARAESTDFARWSEPRRVYDADRGDPSGTQIYGMGISRYEGLYIGLPWMFHITSSQRIDIQLASSRDGQRWQRVGNRQLLIPNGPPDSWDAGVIFTASQPVQRKDNRIFIFYSASSHDHDHDYLHADPTEKGTPEWFQRFSKVGTSIGVATLRLDGFVSLEAGSTPGTLTTRPFVWQRDAELHLNADASSGAVPGAIRVEVLTAAGTATEDVHAQPIRGDQVEVVAVPRAQTSSLVGRQVRLRFHLEDAALYAWWLDFGKTRPAL